MGKRFDALKFLNLQGDLRSHEIYRKQFSWVVRELSFVLMALFNAWVILLRDNILANSSPSPRVRMFGSGFGAGGSRGWGGGV